MKEWRDPRCGKILSTGNTCNAPRGHAGYCRFDWSKEAKPNRPSTPVLTSREHRMTRIHGPEVFDWWALTWARQDGKCYLCGESLPDEPRKSHIDHDYSCCPRNKSCEGCRRGITHPQCNQIIGLAHEDPEKLIRIALNMRRIGAV